MEQTLLLPQILCRISAFTSQLQPFPVFLPKNNSTENALLLALDNIYISIDQGLSTLLDSLDLSAAFDTINHSILINRLHTCYGITSIALAWFRSYAQRSQFVRIGSAKLPITNCNIAVPQRFLLEPVLFSVYLYPMAQIASAFGLNQQQYADDTQLYIAMSQQIQDTAV